MHKWKWYVYELSDADGVFYVGKGTGKRIETTQKEGNPAKRARAENCEANIVAYFKSETDALEHEIDRITSYKGLTNIRHNTGWLEVLQKFIDAEWSKVYRNVIFDGYMSEEYAKVHELTGLVYEKISKDIKCHAAVSARDLADHLVHLIRKLPRSNKPLSYQERHRLIISSLS